MATLETIQQWLEDAENALHLLQTGGNRVLMERNGTKIVYTPANIGALKSYIVTLQSQIRAAGGTIPGIQPTRRKKITNYF